MHKPSAALVALALVLVSAQGAAGLGEQVPTSLVFERSRDLYRMRLDGSETVRLTAAKAKEGGPAVSPDRLRIAFVRGDELWQMNTNGAEQKKVLAARPQTVKYAGTSAPSWSADGRNLYVARSAQGPNEICGWIYRIGADGQGLRKVTRGTELHSNPAVSPDGRRIAFIAGECVPGLDCCHVQVVDTAGRRTNDLRKLSGRFLYEDVSWSPDGGHVALEVNIDDEAWAVFVANRDGSGLRRVTPRGLNAEEPAWSPDGEWIAFAGWTQSRSYDLYIVHPDGTGLRELTRTKAEEHSPAWLLRT